MTFMLGDVGTSLSEFSEKALTATVIFLVLSTLVQLLYTFTSRMLHMDELYAQLIRTIFQFAILVGCLIIILGQPAVMTLVGGFSIGFGYSLQPAILGALQMIYLRSEHRLNGKRLQIGNVKGIVASSGLFHIKLIQNDGTEIYISNVKLTENITFL